MVKHNIFEQKSQKTQKMLIIRQIDWHQVGWPLSCNAFAIAIARFLVLFNWILIIFYPFCYIKY